MSTPSGNEDELTKWILERSVRRVLVRMTLSGSEFAKPGDETVYVELVTYGSAWRTMLHLQWSFDPLGNSTSMNPVFKSNPKAVGKLASRTANSWATDRNWGEKQDGRYGLHIYRDGAPREERPLQCAIVRQHLARLHGAILMRKDAFEMPNAGVLGLTARRLQVVITEGNMSEIVH